MVPQGGGWRWSALRFMMVTSLNCLPETLGLLITAWWRCARDCQLRHNATGVGLRKIVLPPERALNHSDAAREHPLQPFQF